MRVIPPAAGMGCHPARAIALLRALTEAAQSRLTRITGSRDDLGDNPHSLHRNTAVEEGTLPTATCRFDGAPDWDSDTLEADVEWELERLQSAGIKQVIAVDLTKDAFKLPVVRVIIPGLEGLREVPGYIPGKRAQALIAGAA
jgi:ribosomal protein S12 methylthiotransferase accessory factor